MLEPRRLAARAAARRISQLIGEEPGGLIGYQTRDERVIGSSTRLEIVTEGILTRRLQNDPSIDNCGLVIFDEVHERNLPTDLGLALCLDVRRNLREDLRILAMSATAEAERFAKVLGSDEQPAPIVRSDGRMFDVDIIWAPPARQQRLDDAVSSVVQRALREHDGDVLVFLPGIAEIERVRRALSESAISPNVDVWPLAGALSSEDQDRALSPSPPGRRRVVLSTDIAETSLTVDGIRVVVDAGQARIPQFDTRSGMTRLTTVAASRASCDQRTGRAGRVEPGVAYRLWSKIEHGTRRSHLDPEIAHADLTSFALDIAAWGTPANELTFLQSPPHAAYTHAQDLLVQLGALDADKRVTELGRRMLGVPVHPRLAKMIVAAGPNGHSLACLLAALIDERDIVHGSLDDKPVDLSVRIALITGASHDARTDRSSIQRLRSRAQDLARRTGRAMDWDSVDGGSEGSRRAAALLLFAYPDRVAVRRQPGQFQMVSGSGAWLPRTDPLAHASFLIATDLDGNRKSARIRIGLPIEEDVLIEAMGHEIREDRTIKWDKERGDIVEHVVVHLASMRIAERKIRPAPSEATSDALFDHFAQRRFVSLLGTDAVRNLTARVQFLQRTLSSDSNLSWPDWSDKQLVSTAHEWLRPYLAGMTSLVDVESLNIGMLLRSHIPSDLGPRLDELAPRTLTLASGRVVSIDYARALEDGTAPAFDVRVQDMFGTRIHPAIAGGRVPLVIRLLSPADRPIQVTSDLPGFWNGSWSQVRKDLAGRYPKHQWPIDPASADPKRLKDR